MSRLSLLLLTFLVFALGGCGARLADSGAMGKAPASEDAVYASLDSTGNEVNRVARGRAPASVPASPASMDLGFEGAAFGAAGAFGPGMMAGDAFVGRTLGSTASSASPLTQDRLLTKEGGLWLRVANIERTQLEAVAIIEGEGGLIVKSQIGSIEARVPPARFEDTMNRLAAIGVVAQRWTNVQDVTEQVADLDLRIRVARDSFGRLSELLAKAEKVEDMLNIEKELRRLTQEIESMEGDRRGITRRVESSSIAVTIEQLVEVANQPRDLQSFPWITDTSINAVRVPGEGRPLRDTGWLARALFGRPFELGGAERGRLPEGLVPIIASPTLLLGTTPEDHRLRARIVEPPQEANLEFWSAALRRSLENIRGYEVLESGAAKVNDAQLAGTRLDTRVRFEGELWRYSVWVVQRAGDEHFAVVEAAWREAETTTVEAKAEAAVAGLRIR
jgi:hypothetical protein